MQDVPYGFCQCGCGRKTAIAKQTRTDRGVVKGEPQPFFRGHNIRNTTRRWPISIEDRGYETPCHIWGGSLDRFGYGNVRRNGRTLRAHRVAYEQAFGPIPRGPGYHGYAVCHKCDVPACVNPEHLFLATQLQNLADMSAKGRRRHHLGASSHRRISEETGRAILAALQTMTQMEAAAAFGISQATVSDIKVGRLRWATLHGRPHEPKIKEGTTPPAIDIRPDQSGCAAW